MGGVRGILLDVSVLLSPSAGDDDDVNVETLLRPGSIFLLRKLRYSKIPFGISYARGLSSPKEFLLREMASTYSCTIFCFSAEDDISSEVARIWKGKGGTLIHVVSGCGADIQHKENGSAWLKVTVGFAEEKTSSDTEYDVENEISNIIIQKLEELPLLICNLNKKAIHKEVLVVGYVMKPSREEDFAKRGAFPLRPTQNGLMFLPLNYELPILSQLRLVDAVLHKATDEILAVDMDNPSEFSEKVAFTRNLQELQSYRLKIQQILNGLETFNSQGRSKIRPPHYFKEFQLQSNLRLQVDSFHDDLEQRLAEAKLSLPNIVKPQVACGVSDAHSMIYLKVPTSEAIVFKVGQYKDLNVPLPAVVQEYVDHSSLVYKFYALGGKVFYAIKKSTPSADTLMNLFADKGLKPLHFDRYYVLKDNCRTYHGVWGDSQKKDP
ncbi:hypothetical protein OROHE_025324 [Orobanche hederae]